MLAAILAGPKWVELNISGPGFTNVVIFSGKSNLTDLLSRHVASLTSDPQKSTKRFATGLYI
jgi:hypothetical protein